jgi:hypothetical protein
MSIDRLEEAINDIADKDWSWWPFLWLRPARHTRLPLRTMILLALLYGIPVSILIAMGTTLARTASPRELALTGSATPLLFLFVGTVVVAPMWNRRAARLRARGSVVACPPGRDRSQH